MNVGNSFGFVVLRRTFVSNRYVAASARGGPASVTRKRPSRAGLTRRTTTVHEHDPRRPTTMGATGSASGPTRGQRS